MSVWYLTPGEAKQQESRSQPKQQGGTVKRASRKYALLRQYGIDERDYEMMYEAQGGVCAICHQPETAKAGRSGGVKLLAVDHDHMTGAIRGLLCQQCNMGIGNFNEDPARLRSALRYIDECRKSQIA